MSAPFTEKSGPVYFTRPLMLNTVKPLSSIKCKRKAETLENQIYQMVKMIVGKLSRAGQ